VVTGTTFRGNWATMWNGNLDAPGQLQNDGSNTILLIRRRGGTTQANPTHPAGLLWGKAVLPDLELVTPVIDPQDGLMKDQWGDGDLDEGQPNGIGGVTRDYVGTSTPFDLTDDLEIVDEVSYEGDRGWEYDFDDRHVDIGSTIPALGARRVHALDDPQGFTPDGLARVDYRTSGPGWPPAPGAVGELPNGNNWQDTATEQWIRGESLLDFLTFDIFFDNGPNTNPDSIQPFNTNVPLWLDDGIPPDYDFSTDFTYSISPGRVNPLAIPFIPGDADRDGDCDAADIARIAAVFGDDDWVFSNADPMAPEGNDGDPSTQTRPWNVDATGDNGIEASDLQWTLNFQGNANGRVVGVRYDSPTPSAIGVVLNSNGGVQCTVTSSAVSSSGHSLDDLAVGDLVDVTVSAQVTAGANSGSGQQNGIMQFVQDLTLTSGGVLKVIDVTPLGSFAVTRTSLIAFSGMSGDTGAGTINGYTTSFTQGLGSPTALYRVRLQAIGLGSTTVVIASAANAKFAASTPRGLKLGHTQQNGNPALAAYPAPFFIDVVHESNVLPGDCDSSGAVVIADIGCFTDCMDGPAVPSAACPQVDFDLDGDVDLNDWVAMEAAISAP